MDVRMNLKDMQLIPQLICQGCNLPVEYAYDARVLIELTSLDKPRIIHSNCKEAAMKYRKESSVVETTLDSFIRNLLINIGYNEERE